ncbi:hypothetical protein MUK42_23775 [Musa troglodytarum]|uniref:Uncharacterized protein n=1 Tax=Musa troglodytarum TaxID=320322 RepID=A0A9E7K9C8_9LILI|nr:hypothetical protein MUK42_23775 [Musa troglodytarum]
MGYFCRSSEAKRAQTAEASRTRVFRSWFKDKQNGWMVWVIASAVTRQSSARVIEII